ncbi:dihydroorotase [Desulfovibrio oxyclinae]|uniref:dihydroorotase n=1 Tax=Desulfovibrio oxyclinae TaxID=63560 RepID=UPI00036FA08E|nr:dihydroorotase [Desulfovibrio oxyclinae]
MSRMDLLVRRAMFEGREVDVIVNEGRIVEIRDCSAEIDLEEFEQVEDAYGLQLMASMTDVHVHLREPGFEYKEDIRSGLGAAAWGGFGNVLCMANTSPVNDSASVTEAMQEKANIYWPEGPRLFPIGALTKGLKGDELAPVAELRDAGCVAVSNDGVPVKNTDLFRKAMDYAANFGMTVIDHCEDPYMAVGVGVNEGEVSDRLGLAGQPDVAEALQVSRDVLLAEYLDIPIHLAHVSCEKAVEIIRQAKARGVKVTAETCPHYLLLTDEWLAEPENEYSAMGKVNPPLRTERDRQAMIAALNDGTIDFLATDHAPHGMHEKEVEMDVAPCGISGLDTALAATWALVQDGTLSREAFDRAWVTGPAQTFGLPVNRFQPGDTADFFLFDPEEEWVVGPGTMHSKGKNTPLAGTTLKGRVKTHFLAGKKIV